MTVVCVTADDTVRWCAHSLCLEIAEHAQPSKPILLLLTPAQQQAMITVHAMAGSQATLLCFVLGESPVDMTDCTGIKLLLEKDAQLNFSQWHQVRSQGHQCMALYSQQGENSRLQCDHFYLGQMNVTQIIHHQLCARGAGLRSQGLMVTPGVTSVHCQSRIHHLASATHSEQQFRGCASDQSAIYFRGRIIVDKHCKQVSADQASHHLQLSPRTSVETYPELEIFSDDLSCSHGATIGQLDPEQCFFLQSRGLSQSQAWQLLTNAFKQVLLEQSILANWCSAQDLISTMERLG